MTLEQSLPIGKTLHMHVKFGTFINNHIQIWMLFFDTLTNTKYSKDHIMLCNSPLFFNSIINPSCCFACCAKIWKDIEAHVKHGINKGMHEHLAIGRCNVPIVAKCPPWMGKVQHPWWIWRCMNTSTKTNWQIYLWLLGKFEGNLAREVGKRGFSQKR